jgi:REP element-mobilizing transposase RayT
MPDHIHIFIGMRPHQSISSLVQNVKAESSKWINSIKPCENSFKWQEGYGAFSYSKSHVYDVIRYIQIRIIITGRKHFWKNIKECYRHLKWNLMNNIFSHSPKIKILLLVDLLTIDVP